MSMLANFEAVEGTGNLTCNLTRASRKLVITNDDSSASLLYKFNESEEWGTLLATESLSMYFTTRTVYIQADGDWRIWSFG